MSTSFWGWVVWFLFLFALDFTIPFIGFKGVPKVTGSFLFWIVWVIVAIVSMFVIFSRWREDHGDRQGGKP
jgi:hypothetical protein